MLPRTSRLVAGLMIVPLLATPGCSWKGLAAGLGIATVAGVAAAAVVYSQGDLEADIDVDIDDVEFAVQQVIDQRGYSRDARSVDDGEITIDAIIPAPRVDEDARDLTVMLEQELASEPTHISIRVGTFGDEALSRLILNDIEAELARMQDPQAL